MNLADITTKCYILALIIRDDGERLLLGDGAYEFKDSQQHFIANTYANDVVELQGTDGQMLAGQVRRTAVQTFAGYIGDATFSKQAVESARRDFLMFFRKKHYYTAVYVFSDGTAIQRDRGYIVNAPSVPELYQRFPEWSIGLNFEDPNYYEYAEDDLGQEIAAHRVELELSTAMSGGLIWDGDGAVSDDLSYVGTEIEGEGKNFQLADTGTATLKSAELLGDAEQDGTPTPDSPIPVQVVTGENDLTISDGDSQTQTYPVNLGKNLFDKDNMDELEGYYVGGDGAITSGNGNYLTWVQLQPNTTYTLSQSVRTRQTTRVGLFSSPITTSSTGVVLGTFLSGTTIKQTFTTTDTNRYLAWVYWNGSQPDSGTYTRDMCKSSVQLEKGSTATDYAPYFTPIELAKIGDYQDRIYKDDGKWYIEKQVGKHIISSSDGWGWIANDKRAWTGVLSTLIEAPALNTAVDGLCDRFKASSFNQVSQQENVFAVYTTGTMSFRNSSWASLDDAQADMFGSTVYYALATPTTTEITNSELVGQLERLQHAHTYADTTNFSITATSPNLPAYLKVVAFGDDAIPQGGYVWEDGGTGGATIITVDGVDNAQPIWTVVGPATNPSLTNITTGESIQWTGVVPNGQTLVVNMADMTASLSGANVFEFISGSWITLQAGNNRVSYSATAATGIATLEWNGVVG